MITEIKAEKMGVFINSVASFFSQIGESLDGIDTPYLNDNIHPVAYDFSGIITITGPLQGCVYVSTSSVMLRNILVSMKEPDSSLALLKDLVGEIANTVSGNARTEFGASFIISPPKVVDGAPSPNYLPRDKRSYIIPFQWQNHDGVIGICLE